MRQVFYAGTILTTGDEIATALLGVVMRVAESGRPERVEVPCRSIDASSELTFAEVVVVPGAPMLAVQVQEVDRDLIDSEAVTRLRSRPNTPQAVPRDPADSMIDPNASYDFDEWI